MINNVTSDESSKPGKPAEGNSIKGIAPTDDYTNIVAILLCLLISVGCIIWIRRNHNRKLSK